MNAPLSALAENGPLAATLLADALLEQTWSVGAPETWFAAPLIVMLTCAFAVSHTPGAAAAATIDRLTTAIRSRRGAGAAVGMALRELRALAGAREVLVAVDAASSASLLFVEPGARDTNGDSLARRLGTNERSIYFFAAPASADPGRSIVAFEATRGSVPPGFAETHRFDHLVSFAFRSGEWDGRLFLLDPHCAVSDRAMLKKFGGLLRQLVPAIGRVCDLHAQRHRAEDRERARIGRELHDGIVQELACLDIELELIGNAAAAQGTGVRERIGRVQERLRSELTSLRRLLHDARYRDVDASRLPAVLEAMVRRFGRDARMRADYVSQVSEVRLPPHVCGEIARIVQEALVNVRRHSGARHVVVTFSCDNTDWKLSIQDDGRGFSDGRRSRADAGRHPVLPPSVIHERVHSLGGTVRVVAPGPSGARIEISAQQRDVWNRMA